MVEVGQEYNENCLLAEKALSQLVQAVKNGQHGQVKYHPRYSGKHYPEDNIIRVLPFHHLLLVRVLKQ